MIVRGLKLEMIALCITLHFLQAVWLNDTNLSAVGILNALQTDHMAFTVA